MSHRDIRAAAIVVAAGSGQRLGANQPKALVELAGTPLIVRAVRGIIDSGTARTIVITAPQAHVDEFTRLISAAVGPNPASDILVVAGGASRQDSVAAGLAALPPETSHVLVHDAARCLAPPSLIKQVFDALESGSQAVIPALPVSDTIKEVTQQRVTATPNRANLRAVQTPQGFEIEVLRRAHAMGSAGTDEATGATDDAALVEALNVPVDVVLGSDEALKITTPADLERAAAFLTAQPAPQQTQAPFSPALLPRTGIAIDVHPINTGSDAPLCVAGLKWPDKPGLSGHSDGDVVAHAVCDAVLSAAGLGDLGTHFGTSDSEYFGAPGERFLQETAVLVREAGFQIGNVAVQLVGPFPRLADRRVEAEQVMSTALGAPVSLAATTTDGLGFVGRGDGLAAIATALVVRVS